MGSLGPGLPRGLAELGRLRSRPAGENTGGAGRPHPEQLWVERGWGWGGGQQKVADFLWDGGVCLPEPIPWGPRALPAPPTPAGSAPPRFLEVRQSDLGVRPFTGTSGGGSYTPRGEKGPQRREGARGKTGWGPRGGRGPGERSGQLNGRRTQGRGKEARGERVHWGRKGVGGGRQGQVGASGGRSMHRGAGESREKGARGREGAWGTVGAPRERGGTRRKEQVRGGTGHLREEAGHAGTE